MTTLLRKEIYVSVLQAQQGVICELSQWLQQEGYHGVVHVQRNLGVRSVFLVFWWAGVGAGGKK